MDRKFLIAEVVPRYGWKTILQQKSHQRTMRVSIVGDVCSSLALVRGQPAHLYVFTDVVQNRQLIGFYVDGKEIDGSSKTLNAWKETGGAGYAQRKKAATSTEEEEVMA